MDISKEYDEQGLPWINGNRQFLSVTEYATKEGISRQTALWRIKKGKVEAQKVGSIWIIEEESANQKRSRITQG